MIQVVQPIPADVRAACDRLGMNAERLWAGYFPSLNARPVHSNYGITGQAIPVTLPIPDEFRAKGPLGSGVKYDSEKPRMDLLPPRALVEVAKVLSFGASKYAPGNWKRVSDLQARYTAAALRHIADHMIDQNAVDEESHIDTLAHAICCLMFKLEDKLEKDQGTSTRKADES